MPNYITIVDQIDPAGAWNGVTIDGKIMGLPGVNVAVTSGAAMVTRRDWMEAGGGQDPREEDARLPLRRRLEPGSARGDAVRLPPRRPGRQRQEGHLRGQLFWGHELRSIENEFFWKVIIGEVDADAEWDAYVAQWRKVGGDELTAEANRRWMATR